MSDLAERFLADDLSPEELEELAEALRQRDQAEELIRAAADSWGLVRSLTAVHAEEAGLSKARADGQPARRRLPILMPVLTGMAAAAAILLAVLWWRQAEQPPSGQADAPQTQAAVLEQEQEQTEPHGQLTMVAGVPPIDATSRLAAGQALVFPAGSIGDLRLADGGSSVRVHGPAELVVASARQLHGRRGRFEAQVVAQPAGHDWLLTTPHARCRVLGTRLTVQVDEAATLLEVAEGRVELTPRTGPGAPEVIAAGASRLVADRATDALAPLLHYRFTGRGNELYACDGSSAEQPPLRDRLPPVEHENGLLLTFANSCTTAVNTEWPKLAARLRQADGLTLIATVDLLEAPTRGMLIAEVYGQVADPGTDALAPVVLQVRCSQALAAGSYTLAATWSPQGVVHRYVDGASMGEPFDKAYLWPRLADTLEVKLLMPYVYHRQDVAHAGVVFRNLKLYDRALTAAEITLLSTAAQAAGH